MLVKSWMKTNPKVLKASDSLQQAKELMDNYLFRRIPVVDDKGQLVGIVSKHDISSALPSVMDGSSVGSSMVAFDSARIGDIMTTNPVSYNVMTPLEAVAKDMMKHKFGGAPVVENGRVVGIITETDIYAAFAEAMGVDRQGMRMELLISKTPREFYSLIRLFERHDVEVMAISVHRDFSESQHLITAKVFGQDYDDLLDDLRDSGVHVQRIDSAEWV